MKRLLGSIIAAIVLIAAVAAFDVKAAVNDFTIKSYDIQYELSTDKENRSQLKTVETITANFPNSEQNRGIERMIPTSYNGHSTSLVIQRVTNDAGQPLQYEQRSERDGTVVRIGDPDAYVQGQQTYVIEYTQRDVTRFFENTQRDEWYWDTNGTDWRVPIDQLSVSIKLSGELARTVTGSPACYIGAAGSTARCTLQKEDEQSYSVSAANLGRSENVTVAFGFPPQTFAAYQQSLAEKLFNAWVIVLVVSLFVAVAALIIFSVIWYRRHNRTSELHTIPVQYIPRRDVSVTLAAKVITPRGSSFTAQLIDLAVRRVVQIVELSPAKGIWVPAKYEIVITGDVSKEPAEVQEILRDMWNKNPVVGDRLSLDALKKDTKFSSRAMDNDKKLSALIEGSYAVREKIPAQSRFFYKWAIAWLVIGLLLLSPALLFLALILWIQGYLIRPFTNKGLELRRYLLGFDTYIKAAETERLKFLQGPDTAEKVGEVIDATNQGQILKLYERALPYAILFGHEKKWAKQIGELYDATGQTPGWYNGSTAFNAVVFASAMNSFSTAAAYSGGSSASTGGSSGGGASGGGGGGGGGGGW